MTNAEIALQLTVKAMEVNFGRTPSQRPSSVDEMKTLNKLYIESVMDFYRAALEEAKSSSKLTSAQSVGVV